MRVYLLRLIAASLLGVAGAAYAADSTGTIKSLDAAKNSVTLETAPPTTGRQERQPVWPQGRREGQNYLHSIGQDDGRFGDYACRLITRFARPALPVRSAARGATCGTHLAVALLAASAIDDKKRNLKSLRRNRRDASE